MSDSVSSTSTSCSFYYIRVHFQLPIVYIITMKNTIRSANEKRSKKKKRSGGVKNKKKKKKKKREKNRIDTIKECK